MLKHLPEGVTPFEDCGYARYPLFPMENEPFEVACLAEGLAGEPTLAFRVNGEARAALRPYQAKNGFYRFRLPGQPFGEVAYAFVAGNERSREYAATICRETTLTASGVAGAPFDGVSCKSGAAELPDGGMRLCFPDGTALTVYADECLTLIYDTNAADAGDGARAAASLTLPEGFSCSIGEGDALCKLKRSSTTLLALESLRVLRGGDGRALRLTATFRWSPKHVWGTGERFDAVDQRGRSTNGRVTEKFTRQGDQTYLPVPFLMTDAGYALHRRGSIPAAMRFGERLEITQLLDESGRAEDALFFGEPRALLSRFIRSTGLPELPPEWSFGVWISANGWNCDAEVDAQLAAIKRYDYPASVMVLEAWSDERTFHQWNGDGSWKDPAATVRRIRDAGLRLLLWQIPIIKYEWDGDWGEALRADEREAIARGYCVQNGDGTPYRVTDRWFKNSLLPDFTNPEAVKWWFSKRKYLLDMGVSGFKTDGGEFLFDHGARLHDGTRGLAAQNLYPCQYVGAYRDFLRENGVRGLTFSRAGYAGAQTMPAHWAGDQVSLFCELESQLNAGISAGLSGVLFWGFDIGGFAGELPSKELYLRATALACFCPIMQWHAEPRGGQFYQSHERGFNNDRSPWNLAEKMQDDEVLTIALQYARYRERMRPYLYAEAEYCVSACRPMMAHLCVDFPDDARACDTDDEYMLGRSLLVAPIVREGAVGRAVYLPRGTWRDVFTGAEYAGGQTFEAACDLSRAPVYQRIREVRAHA